MFDEGHFGYDIDGACVVSHVNDPEISSLMLQDMINTLQQLMHTHGVKSFVLDLENVEFLNSPCVGVLVAFLNIIKAYRGELALGHCSDSVDSLLQVAGLYDSLGVTGDFAQTVARLKCG